MIESWAVSKTAIRYQCLCDFFMMLSSWCWYIRPPGWRTCQPPTAGLAGFYALLLGWLLRPVEKQQLHSRIKLDLYQNPVEHTRHITSISHLIINGINGLYASILWDNEKRVYLKKRKINFSPIPCHTLKKTWSWNILRMSLLKKQDMLVR